MRLSRRRSRTTSDATPSKQPALLVSLTPTNSSAMGSMDDGRTLEGEAPMVQALFKESAQESLELLQLERVGARTKVWRARWRGVSCCPLLLRLWQLPLLTLPLLTLPLLTLPLLTLLPVLMPPFRADTRELCQVKAIDVGGAELQLEVRDELRREIDGEGCCR